MKLWLAIGFVILTGVALGKSEQVTIDTKQWLINQDGKFLFQLPIDWEAIENSGSGSTSEWYCNQLKNECIEIKIVSSGVSQFEIIELAKNYSKVVKNTDNEARVFIQSESGMLESNSNSSVFLYHMRSDQKISKHQFRHEFSYFFSSLDNLVVLHHYKKSVENNSKNLVSELIPSSFKFIQMKITSIKALLNVKSNDFTNENKINILRKASENDEDCKECFYQLAIEYIEAKEFDDSLKTLNKILNDNPNDRKALWLAALAHSSLDDYTASKEKLELLFQVDPTDKQVILNLIEACQKLNDVNCIKKYKK